jgi:hypothetical protein
VLVCFHLSHGGGIPISGSVHRLCIE